MRANVPNFQTMFPALRTIYGNRKYSAHIYTFVVAGAGAGKGGAMNGVILARKTDRKLESIYIAERKEFEKMPDTFRYSDFRDEVEKAGFSTNAAKRALKKYVLNGLLSRDDSMYKKTKTLKKRYI